MIDACSKLGALKMVWSKTVPSRWAPCNDESEIDRRLPAAVDTEGRARQDGLRAARCCKSWRPTAWRRSGRSPGGNVRPARFAPVQVTPRALVEELQGVARLEHGARREGTGHRDGPDWAARVEDALRLLTGPGH